MRVLFFCSFLFASAVISAQNNSSAGTQTVGTKAESVKGDKQQEVKPEHVFGNKAELFTPAKKDSTVADKQERVVGIKTEQTTEPH